MTPEQKQRAMQMLRRFSQTTPMTRTADNAAVAMAALLQDLVDAPEAAPVARVTGYYAGYLSISTIDGRVLPAGTALYLAPPAPSVPDGWKLVPVEPTPEMMRSGMNVPVNKAARHNAVYRAMLKEAPQPPKLSDERILELFGFDGASDTVLGQLIRERCLQLGRAIEREILGGAYE